MAKRHKKHRRGHHGVGTTVTLRGFGKLGTEMSALLPVLLGAGVTGGTMLGARYFTIPGDGTPQTDTQKSVYKYAPWIGLLAGAVTAVAVYMLGKGKAGMGAAIATIGTSAAVTGIGVAADQILAGTDANAAIAAQALRAPDSSSHAGFGSMYTMRPNGMGAVVMEPVRGLGAVVPQLSSGGMGDLGYTSYVGGEKVNLSGVNEGAFGTRQFAP
jgi:hypothetical protein